MGQDSMRKVMGPVHRLNRNAVLRRRLLLPRLDRPVGRYLGTVSQPRYGLPVAMADRGGADAIGFHRLPPAMTISRNSVTDAATLKMVATVIGPPA